MRRVIDEWLSYNAAIVPTNAPTNQREECRRAFYAGAFAMFGLVLAASEPEDEAQCERNMDALAAEAKAIVNDLRINAGN